LTRDLKRLNLAIAIVVVIVALWWWWRSRRVQPDK
jgi:hypothetical protein